MICTNPHNTTANLFHIINSLNPYFRYGNGYSVSLFFAKVEDVDEGMNFVASRQEPMN